MREGANPGLIVDGVLVVSEVSAGELAAAAGEVGPLRGVTGETDGLVVGRPRVAVAPESPQQVGARGVEGVVAVEDLGEPVDLGEPSPGAVDLGDRY